MKRVININFQGRVIPIEETAYEILQHYIESLRNYFANEEGKDEIINDIEGRIAELFSEVLKKGSTCITVDDVNAVINSIGRPEEFEGEETRVQSQLHDEKEKVETEANEAAYTTRRRGKLYRDENDKLLGGVCSGIANYFDVDPTIIRIVFLIAFGITFLPYLILWVVVPSSAVQHIGSARKRLMRDHDSKIIGGVCSGLAHYFKINVWIPRVLFLIPFISMAFNGMHWGAFGFPNFLNLSFSPGATLLYIILWIILPEARSTSEKLEMKGEKVDLNSIRNSISEEMKGVQQRVTKMGKEASQTAREKGKQMGTEFSQVARRGGRSLGDIILLLFKIFAYFILGVVTLAAVSALFGIGIAFTGMLPLKGYIINSGWQNVFVWGTLILFIWVPVVGIITWIVRKVAKIKSNNHVIRYVFISLWTLGWVCLFGLISTLGHDFSSRNSVTEQSIPLSNPWVNMLEVKAQPFAKYYTAPRWLHLEPFAGIDADTAYVRNVRIRIVKAASDSFNVKMVKLSNGSSRQDANSKANAISYSINQQDSLLLLDKGIPITPNEKFRNQSVIITIAVPLGKRILIHDDAGWSNFSNEHMTIGWNGDDWHNYYDEEAEDWSDNVEYVMTTNGLKPVNPERDHFDWKDDERNDMNEELQEIEREKQQLEQRRKELENSFNRDSIQKQLQDSSQYKYEKVLPAKSTDKQTVTGTFKQVHNIRVSVPEDMMYSTIRFAM